MSLRQFIYIFFMVVTASTAASQTVATTVSGVVRDSLTREPIPFATVVLTGTERGVLTDDDGRYSITTSLTAWDSIRASAMGYRQLTLPRPKGSNVRLDFYLRSTGLMLSTLTARPRREHYSKRNNPAVDFMQRIRAAAHLGDPRNKENYNYDKYERITLAINNYQFNDSARRGIDRRYGFLKEYVDTSALTGVPILNVALREKASSVHHRLHPSESEREYVKGLRTSGIDEILDPASMQTFYEDVLREIDIYDNDIALLQNRFVSPLSRLAPDFYKFYLTDTVTIDTTSCAELTFVPRNASSFGFTGRFYVPLGDSTMFIRKVVLRVPHDINLNFIDGMLITQEFERLPDGTRLKLNDDMIVEARVMPGTPGIYARRNTVYTGHDFSPAADSTIFRRLATQVYAPRALSRKEDFWAAERTTTISHGELSMEQMMTRLRKDPLYYWGEKTLKTITSGYITTGNPSKFDIGPLTSTFSTNYVEGLRLRAGGMTTAALSSRWFGRGYAAHGFRDHKWKYGAEAEYSFIDKRHHSREFPVQSLRITHRYDMNMLGQHFTSNNQDNVFMSAKRMEDLQMTYERVTRLDWIMEFENNFSFNLRLENNRQEPTRYMPFTDGYGRSFGHYTLNSVQLEVRYAPGEKFYQMKTGRLPISFDAPVWTLSHSWAPKGVLGNPFAVAKTEASFTKRWWLSAFGFVDVFIKGGHVWTRSPYPNLLIPNANLSYFLQIETFSCLNPMEFINDSYAQWDLTYWANGALLNSIPLIKKLKLRECVFIRGLSGHLSHRNRPWEQPGLFAFPEDAHTVLMRSTPYMETGVGVDNLFRILRVDYTWRLTYRDNPQACRGGVRFMFHFTF